MNSRQANELMIAIKHQLGSQIYLIAKSRYRTAREFADCTNINANQAQNIMNKVFEGITLDRLVETAFKLDLDVNLLIK